jgi:PIN domain nuclease of toxin-antitoxin system
MRFLLDTHILIWWVQDAPSLPERHRQILSKADPKHPLLLADITLWEIATLHSQGKLRFAIPLREWLERASAPPLVQRCGLTPAVATETAALPAHFPRDPADRIIASTAKVFGATLLTCDRRILEANAVPAL